jgi:hypothetical protein
MGGRQIVLVSTAGFSVLNTGIFWREAITKRLFSQWPCGKKPHQVHMDMTEQQMRYRNLSDLGGWLGGNLAPASLLANPCTRM